MKLFNKLKSKISKLLIVGLFLFTSLPLLNSCASNDVSNNSASLEYNLKNKNEDTLLYFKLKVENNSIYTLNNIWFTIDIYKDNNYLRTSDPINLPDELRYSKTKVFEYSVVLQGSVDEVKLNSWDASKLSILKSYQNWFISFGVILGVSLLAYIIYIFVAFKELKDVFFDVLILYPWLFLVPVLLVIFNLILGLLIPILNYSYVPLLISLLTPISFIIIILIAHLVQHFCYYGFHFDSLFKKEDCISLDILNLYDKRVKTLKEYCKFNEIKNYSKCNKENLIRKIVSNDIAITFDLEKEGVNENSLKKLDEYDLIFICQEYGFSGYTELNKDEIIDLIISYTKEVPNKRMSKKDVNRRIDYLIQIRYENDDIETRYDLNELSDPEFMDTIRDDDSDDSFDIDDLNDDAF